MMQDNRVNGGTRVTISPAGATVFLGVLTITYLETITTREELESLIAKLEVYWSIAQGQPPGQVELTANDERNIHVLMNALIAHLRGSFEL